MKFAMRNTRLPLLVVVIASSSWFLASSSALQCATGLGSQVVDIPEEWLNDGYCDCPLDGADEPGTDACSGSQGWPGVVASSSTSLTFQCPQQPRLQLPLSRLSDGICDCCDGADEGPGVCPDICDELLRAERETRAKLEKDFEIGHNKRKHELFKFKQFRKEKLEEIEHLRSEMATLDPQAPLQKAQDLNLSYAQQRMKTAQSIVAESTLLAGITPSELQTIVVLSCQIAGEVAGRNHGQTCAPLRLAGMEFSMIWGDDNYNEPEGMKIKDDISQLDWATRVFQNAARNEKSWMLLEDGDSKKNTRRRLEEVVIDDDFDDYDGRHHGDDDYMINDHDEDYSGGGGGGGGVGDERMDNLAGLELEMIEGIRALPFSTTRRAFLKRSAELREAIAAVLTPTSNNESDTNETINPVDPAAYDMIKSSLGTKETAIIKGFKSGASASLFFSVNKDLSEDQLRSLAMYTIYHGNLSASQVWHIFLAAVDDLKTIEEERSNEQTCVSPWTGTCPPKTINRGEVVIPSSVLTEAAEVFCRDHEKIAMEACAAIPETNGIPTSIPDGYFGYTTPTVAGDDDPITNLFRSLAAVPIEQDAVEEFEAENSRLEGEIKALEGKISEAWKQIGGKDGTKMGHNGELYSLANQCFSVDAGKYTYEVCVFGQSHQREGGDGGTKLGQFTRMEYKEETGDRTLYWENGQKCWNGPSRSATVHVKCGAENKVLSADEPDTCRYVLEMESYIACDEDYRKRMGL